MGGADAGAQIYDAALHRRKALMGASGPLALVENFLTDSCICNYSRCFIWMQPGHVLGSLGHAEGRLTSVLELGAWLGALLSGFLAEAISRKYGILVATIVFVTGVVIQATAITAGYQAILAGRFITGIGVGSLSVIVPIYNSECAPPEVRGAFVALQQLSICFGIMISFWTD
ncbi:hypothetical protein EsDP_00007443 [Epichloe bromicola]|uniref:Major facilitator superfamily (MFS) profile domain-containing protein n=1 Tax=Epichloe bromicola TaxID=79588 RepID=A0ABQ0D0N0_9HYPO